MEYTDDKGCVSGCVHAVHIHLDDLHIGIKNRGGHDSQTDESLEDLIDHGCETVSQIISQ